MRNNFRTKEKRHEIDNPNIAKYGILTYKIISIQNTTTILYWFAKNGSLVPERMPITPFEIKSKDEIEIINRFVIHYLLDILKNPKFFQGFVNNL